MTNNIELGSAPLGKSEKESDALDRAKEYLSNAFVMLLFFSVILTSFFFIFKDSLLMAFGASKDTLPFASDYLSIYLIGTIFVQLSIGLNPFITAQGKAKTAMVCTDNICRIGKSKNKSRNKR